MKNKPERILDLEITGFSKKGHGLGIDPLSRKIEVPFTIPGDKARVKLLSKRRGVSSSLLEEILEPSPNRIQPRCVHFGSCGGCRWQQQTYEQQLKNKELVIQEYFGSAVKKIIPADPPWHYRNKMEFTFSQSAAKEHFLGLVLDGGKGKAFNLTECHLVDAWFADTVRAVKSWWDQSHLEAYHLHKNTGSLRTLTLREGQKTGDRMVILTVSGNAEYALNKSQLADFVSTILSVDQPKSPESRMSIFLRIQQIAKGTPTNFYEMLLHGPDTIQEVLTIAPRSNLESISLTFNISPAAFFQPNPRQAEKLYSLALQMISIDTDTVVYDLFCGTGTLGMCAAKYAKQVVGIELSPEAVLDAKSNAQLNKIENFSILGGDVGQMLAKIRDESLFPLPNVVMVDPPRVGLGEEAIRQLLNLSCPTILYVSCNPTTQAEDISKLAIGGYQVMQVQPVDQFPHTIHIENIVVLTRSH